MMMSVLLTIEIRRGLTLKSQSFYRYHPDPIGVGGESSSMEQPQGNSVYKDKKLDILISKVKEGQGSCSGPRDGVGLELFDNLCPFKIEFNAPTITFSQELQVFKTTKEQFSNWKNGFKPYQELRNRRKF